MNAVVLELLPNLGTEGQSLLLRPPKNTSEQSKRKALKALINIVVAPSSNLLVVLVLRPRVEGPLELGSLDVDETGFVDPFLEIVA